MGGPVACLVGRRRARGVAALRPRSLPGPFRACLRPRRPAGPFAALVRLCRGFLVRFPFRARPILIAL